MVVSFMFLFVVMFNYLFSNCGRKVSRKLYDRTGFMDNFLVMILFL